MLNAKNDADEAQAISEAGLFGAVTVSTDMAGRGTDIRLAGPNGTEQERARLIGLGGLYVLGTCRRESLRLDLQLRGRAGRQGEPGFTRFFTSLEDSIFERYGVREFLPKGMRDATESGAVDSPLTHPKVQAEIDRAQRIMEGRNHDMRNALREKTLMMELHRKRISQYRDEALAEQDSAEKFAYLKSIDRFWANHLAYGEDLREGIHLMSYGGRNPEKEYNRLLDEEFESCLAGLEGDAQEIIEEIKAHNDGDRTLMEILAKPSATWTYQIDEQGPVASRLPSALGGGMIMEAFVMLPLAVFRAASRLFKSNKPDAS